MAGTLTISTLSDGTNSTSSTNCIQGSAKAWVNFNGLSGASPVIRASFNTSSVTRNSTGTYTMAFTNAMTDANYCVVLGACSASPSDNTRNLNVLGTSGSTGASNKSTTSVAVFSGVTSNTSSAIDSAELNIAIFR